MKRLTSHFGCKKVAMAELLWEKSAKILERCNEARREMRAADHHDDAKELNDNLEDQRKNQ